MKQFGSLVAAIFAAVALSGAAFAEEAGQVSLEQVLQACDVQISGAELGSCFGIALDLCLAQGPESAATPQPCWEDERAIWEQLMTQSHDTLLIDLDTRDYAAFKEQVNAAQTQWATQSRLDCQLEVMSSPRTHETIGTACMARNLMERTLFLRALIGADWAAAD